MSCGGLNQISSLDVPAIDQSFGAALDVSTFTSDKSIELHASAPYAGSYALYGSHNGTLYTPLLSFNSGSGAQSFKESLSIVANFFKVKKLSPSNVSVSMLVAGQATCDTNEFISVGGIDQRTGGGPRPSIDLWTLVAATGINAGFNVMCGGDFQGLIGLEGSLDNVRFNPIGVDANGNPTNGFFIGQKGTGSRPTELSPIIVPDVVRYVRINVQAVINGPVSITIGGSQNNDC